MKTKLTKEQILELEEQKRAAHRDEMTAIFEKKGVDIKEYNNKVHTMAYLVAALLRTEDDAHDMIRRCGLMTHNTKRESNRIAKLLESRANSVLPAITDGKMDDFANDIEDYTRLFCLVVQKCDTTEKKQQIEAVLKLLK